MDDVAFEEVEFDCSSCGRKVRLVKHSGLNMDEALCQRCSNEFYGFDEDDD